MVHPVLAQRRPDADKAGTERTRGPRPEEVEGGSSQEVLRRRGDGALVAAIHTVSEQLVHIKAWTKRELLDRAETNVTPDMLIKQHGYERGYEG